MVRVKVIDWGDDPLIERPDLVEGTDDTDWKVSFPSVTIYVERYVGHSYDGGRLDIDGYPDTIWVSHQHSIYVGDE